MKIIVIYSKRDPQRSHALDRLSASLLRLPSKRWRPLRLLATTGLTLCLTLSWQAQSGLSQASSNENVQPPVLLQNSEARTVLGQLYELQALRVQLTEIRSNVQKELEQYEAEKKLWSERIEMERKAYELAVKRVEVTEHERDLALEKASFYQTSLQVCQQNKKTGFWCKVGKIFTLGLKRCK